MATSSKQQEEDKGNLEPLLTVFETLLGISRYSKVSVYLKSYTTTTYTWEGPEFWTPTIPDNEGMEDKKPLLGSFTEKKVDLLKGCLAHPYTLLSETLKLNSLMIIGKLKTILQKAGYSYL